MEMVVGAEFRGTRPESAPLTWAQRMVWHSTTTSTTQHMFINLRRTLPVSVRVAADLDGATRAVGALVSRHGALRTRIRSVDGGPRQETAVAGQLPLLVVEGEDDGSAAARELTVRLGDVAFDHSAEWPLRVALVLVDDLVRQVVLVFSHSTVDAYAADVVLRDLRLILLRGALTSPPGLQSVDVAQRQHGVDRERSERTVAYWVREFARLPAPEAVPDGPELSPRLHRGVLVSTAVERASRLIAARHGVSSSAVLLAGMTAVAAGQSGRDICGLFTMAHNRFRAEYADAVANLGQIGFGVLELADRPDFTALLSRIWRVSLAGYRHAYYDTRMLRRRLEEAGHDYGGIFRPHYYFNDVRLSVGSGGGRVPASSEPELRAAMQRSTFSWTRGLERSSWHLLTHVVDEPGAVGITLSVDTRFHSPELVEPFLRNLEELLVEAAFRDVSWPWSRSVSGSRG